MSPARYRVNGRTFTFVAVHRGCWLLADADGWLWRTQQSDEIRPRMHMTRTGERLGVTS